MARKPPIHLPVFQRFDCHQCGYCCRHLVVNVTDEERRAILDAGWEQLITDAPLFIPYRFRGRQLHRLAHRPGGGCVFLDEQGLCRLHAEQGPQLKPFACRLYPFVPTPGIDSVRIDLRCDCPSVAGNKGRDLNAQRREVERLVSQAAVQPLPAPPLWSGQRTLSKDEFPHLIGAFDRLLSNQSLGHRDRLIAGARLLDVLYAISLEKIRGERFKELLELVTTAAIQETVEPEEPDAALKPRTARLFRQWLFLHGLSDDPSQLAAGRVGRMLNSWRRYAQARRFARNKGPVPRLGDDWPAIRFGQIERIAPAGDGALEPVCRAMKLKLDTHSFAGPGYFGYDLMTGLTALWLLPSLTGWFARLEAGGTGRDALTADDVIAGLRRTHHTFGVSPVFTRVSERLRMRALARPGVALALLAAYGP